MGHKSEREKKKKNRGSITYSTDQENEVRKMLTLYLGSNKGGTSQFKQTFELAGRTVKLHYKFMVLVELNFKIKLGIFINVNHSNL